VPLPQISDFILQVKMDSWPPPPPYYKLYAEGGAEIEGVHYPTPPAPPPVIQGDYRMFGMPYNTDCKMPTLAESGMIVLSDGGSCGANLQKLTRSALVTYMEMIRGLTQGENQEARLAAIEVMLVNMHYLVNLHRPQQAQDAVKQMMRQEIDRLKQLTQDLKQATDAAEALLNDNDNDTNELPERPEDDARAAKKLKL
jgi:hypothetical protein